MYLYQNSNKFDILYYVRYDIRKAVIPIVVTTSYKKIFANKPKLKTLQFQENPDLKEICPQIFCESTFSKLILSGTIKKWIQQILNLDLSLYQRVNTSFFMTINICFQKVRITNLMF